MTQSSKNDVNEAASPATDRRLVLKTSLATIAALGTGAFSTLANAQPFASSSEQTDVEILNFALNLEYLEAEFYLRAAYGHGLDKNLTGGRQHNGSVTGGSMVPFKTGSIHAYAREIADDERNHVEFLRNALGASKVAETDIDLKHSFNKLAQAAGLGNTFDPFSSEENFLLGAFIFEDVGVTAYHGAAKLITNKDYLDAAAGILAVEAYHAGIIRTLCYQSGLAADANKISELRNDLSAAAGGPAITDQGITRNKGGKSNVANLIPADTNSIAFERTTAEVLNIVYAGGKKNDFGFFPSRLNGHFS
jgi:rubrerythrin